MDISTPGIWYLNAKDSDLKISLYSTHDEYTFEGPGHAVIIRRNSSVLKKMLDSDLKERENKVLELKVKGNKNVSMAFVRYLYTKQLSKLDTYSYVALAQTAHLYAVSELISLCEEHILETVTPYSACSVYTALEDIASEEFKRFIFELILYSACLIFKKMLHVSLKEETMKSLLKHESLNVLDDEEVRGALGAWGRANCFFENQTSKESIDNMLAELNHLAILREYVESDSGQYINNPRSNKNDYLRRYWNVFNPVRGVACTNQKMLYNSVRLISFVVKREIILLGAALHLEYKESFQEDNPEPDDISISRAFTELPFSISIDCLEENVDFDETLTRFIPKNLEWHPRVVQLVFRRPLLIADSILHTIEMNSYATDNWEEKIERKCKIEILPELHFPPSTDMIAPVYNVTENNDSIFEVIGEVTAIWELYYFPI